MRESLNLNQLFEAAKVEPAQVSYEETKRIFLKSSIIAAGGFLASKGLLKLFTVNKWIIMISATTITTGGIITASLLGSSTTEKNYVTQNKNYNSTFAQEHIIPVEDSASETIIFNPAPVEDTNTLNDNHFPELATTKESITPRCSADSLSLFGSTYTITRTTPKSKFDEIANNAEEVGIDFRYNVHWNNGKITRMSLEMKYAEEGKSQHINIVSNNDLTEFNYLLGWNIDEEGKVTTIYCEAEEIEVETGHIQILLDEMESIVNAFDLETKMQSLDTMALEIRMEIEEELEVIRLQTRALSEQINEELEEAKEEEMPELKAEIEEYLQELEKELEELEEEIEAAFEKEEEEQQ